MDDKTIAQVIELTLEEVLSNCSGDEQEAGACYAAHSVEDALLERLHWQGMAEEFRQSKQIPVMEFELVGYECLTIQISVAEGEVGLIFEVLEGLPEETWFSGEVKDVGNDEYLLPFQGRSSLQDCLEAIHDEIMEGYIMPNDLCPD